ncbi:hypothetical protein BVY12_17560 [Pseudomonas amygdali pv. morsprunorum]|nr:hypothetical protein BVY12_17560 [Pseudomonas amygdali pv. morsprunorum]
MNFDLLNEFIVPIFGVLLPSLVLAEVVSQNGGFIVPARLHRGLRTGTELKCTFCSIAPRPPTCRQTFA